MKNGKATREDGMCAEIFQEIPETVLPKLLEPWKGVMLTLLPKVVTPSGPHQYRAVAIVPQLEKLLRQMFRYTFAEKDARTPASVGNRRGHQRGDVIHHVLEVLQNRKRRPRRWRGPPPT